MPSNGAAAVSYSKTGSTSELEKEIKPKSTLVKTARKSLVETERQMKELAQSIKY